MFNKNQHKTLKARGWATQTELVCQDHNRGFVISLYIIFSIFFNLFLLLDLYFSFTIKSILSHSKLWYFCVLFSFFHFHQNLLYNHVSIKIMKNYIVHSKKRTLKSHPKMYSANFIWKTAFNQIHVSIIIKKNLKRYYYKLTPFLLGFDKKQALVSTDIILHRFSNLFILII